MTNFLYLMSIASSQLIMFHFILTVSWNHGILLLLVNMITMLTVPVNKLEKK